MNILAKGVKGKEYIITDMIATRLNEKQFLKIQQQNLEHLGGYRFIKQEDTDFMWWPRINRKLTPKYIRTASFECDFWGNVTEY